MLIKNIIYSNKRIAWTLTHIGLGVLSTVAPFVVIAWFYLVFLSNLGNVIKKAGRRNYFLPMAWLSYLVSFELLARLTDTAPFLPSETGKYLMLFAFSLFCLIGGARGVGIIMALLLLPSVFIDLSGYVDFNRIVFNLFAPLALALGVAALYRVEIQKSDFDSILRLIWLTTLAGLFYIFVKTPDLDTIEFTLESQSVTTAGHASNQVSTLMGIGMFLSFYSILNRLEFSGNRLLDIALMLLFAFQGLISFSRGGILVGIGAMAVLYYGSISGISAKKRGRMFTMGAIAFFSAFIIFQIANTLTGGSLLLRYQGETKGTLVGSKEKSFDALTTGRLSVVIDDLDLWYDHFILGVGCGASQYLRENTLGFQAHVEMSRLLSEHGLLGLIYFILMILFYFKARSGMLTSSKLLTLSLYLIAILTTFHAAMRTYVPPLFYVLSIIRIGEDKNIIETRRKSGTPVSSR